MTVSNMEQYLSTAYYYYQMVTALGIMPARIKKENTLQKPVKLCKIVESITHQWSHLPAHSLLGTDHKIRKYSKINLFFHATYASDVHTTTSKQG